MIFISAWALNLNERKIYEETHNSIIDFLQVHYPNGFDTACTITVNSEPVELDDYDKELQEDDIVVLLFHPGVEAAAVGGSYVYAFIINLLIATAVSYVVGQIFKPTIPSMQSSLSARNTRGQASSVYSLNGQQNEAKFGSVIPIIYGKVRTYPALISPPYYRFENNEEYLYQLMCIGQGKYNIDQMLISDTDASNIQLDYFRYEKLEEIDFSTPSAFNSKVNDTNYHQLVKTIPDVENLELRGTPQNKEMIMKFKDSTITFLDYANGDVPDLSSLSAGSIITIDNTDSNDGTYTVASVNGNIVTVQSHTFVTEPSESILTFNNNYFELRDGYKIVIHNTSQLLEIGTRYKIFGESVEYDILSRIIVNEAEYTTSRYFTASRYLPSVSFERIGKKANATFETSYGAFKYDKPHIGFEIDYIYPQGIYNSDSSGNLIDRTTEFSLSYANDSVLTPSNTVTISQTNRDNSPIRLTHKVMYGDEATSTSITLKRITPEPSDIQSMDKTYIKAIKFIHADPDYSTLGDITLLWCKIRASNAISSIGQFAINAWVTRTDVGNTIPEVIEDVYSNTVYGGRLPSTDLDLPSTTDAVNGAIDSQMTLFDAMRMVGKSNRYSVFPVGGQVRVKKDEPAAIRTALFNETNMIKDSFKISYLFEEEEETDSVKVTYRDPDDFTAQTEIYPSTGAFPSEVELWGCTDQAQALSLATYLYKQDRARRKTVEFKTDIQGLIPQFLDRIAISHNIPNWGFGGQITNINGRVLTLSCDYGRIIKDPDWACSNTYECNATFFPNCADGSTQIYDKILFRNSNGSVSDMYSFTIVGTGVIELTTDAPAWLYVGPDYDNTYFTIGSTTEMVKDYTVISVKPDTKDTVTISCTNYDESIYS